MVDSASTASSSNKRYSQLAECIVVDFFPGILSDASLRDPRLMLRILYLISPNYDARAISVYK